jgi:hypothetical protein
VASGQQRGYTAVFRFAVFEIFDVNDNLIAAGCGTEAAKRVED